MFGKKPEIGIGVIVMKGEEILLVKRNNVVFGAGMWSAPIGFLRPRETFEECAVRQLSEAVGVMIVDARFIALTDYTLTGGSQSRFITIWMQSRHINGVPYARDKSWISDIGWFKLRKDSLPSPNQIFFTLKHFLSGDCYTPHGGVDHLKSILSMPVRRPMSQLSSCCDAPIINSGGPVLIRHCDKCKEPIISLPLVRGV